MIGRMPIEALTSPALLSQTEEGEKL